MTKNIDESVYFDGSKILSYNAPVNIIVGERSEGKTYWFKRKGIKNFLRDGSTWVYLRRHDSIFKKTLNKRPFFGDVAQEFPNVEFKVDGRDMLLKREGDSKWQVFGHFAALSQAQTYKGTTDPTCTMLVYDEFINEHKVPPYLPNEPAMLMNLWETLDRREDRVKIVMLANAADLINPYFLEWNIILDKPGIRRYRNGLLVVQWDDNPAFADHAAESNIGRFTAGTGYDDYARGNIFIGSGSEFIQEKSKNSRPVCCLVYRDQKFGIWRDSKQGVYNVSKKVTKDMFVFSLTTDDHRPNLIMLENADPFIKTLVQHYRFGMLFFDSPAIRESFMQALRMLGRLR